MLSINAAQYACASETTTKQWLVAEVEDLTRETGNEIRRCNDSTIQA
jgi:hypothetical protein